MTARDGPSEEVLDPDTKVGAGAGASGQALSADDGSTTTTPDADDPPSEETGEPTDNGVPDKATTLSALRALAFGQVDLTGPDLDPDVATMLHALLAEREGDVAPAGVVEGWTPDQPLPRDAVRALPKFTERALQYGFERVARDAANAAVEAGEAADEPPPRVIVTSEWDPEEDDGPLMRVEGLAPVGFNLWVGPPKSGKTTALDCNLAIDVLTGNPLFGHFPVRALPDDEHVVVLDTEMHHRRLLTWMREARAVHPRLTVIPLIGTRWRQLGNDHLRQRLVDKHITAQGARKVGLLIVESLRPVFGAMGLSERSDGEPVVEALRRLVAEVAEARGDGGSVDLHVGHHTNHVEDRAGGDSTLMGSPDALIEVRRMRRDGDGTHGQVVRDDRRTWLFAEGRDVMLEEAPLQPTVGDPRRLQFDPTGLSRAGVREAEQEARQEAQREQQATAAEWADRYLRQAVTRLYHEHGHGQVKGAVRDEAERMWRDDVASGEVRGLPASPPTGRTAWDPVFTRLEHHDDPRRGIRNDGARNNHAWVPADAPDPGEGAS